MKRDHGGYIWEAARRLGIAPSEIIDFSASVNPLGLPESAREAAARALSVVSAYPDPGCRELNDKLSRRHGIPPGCILAGNGSTELIHLIPRVFRPARALIVEPAFSEYARSLGLAGSEISRLILTGEDGFLPGPEALAGAMKDGIGLAFLANPSNPTGALMTKDAVLEAADAAVRAGCLLVVDEAFADFAEEESVVSEAARRPGLIVLRSLTKFFSMAGLRLGYLAAAEDTVEALTSALPPWSVNTVAAAAGAAALEDGEYIRKTLTLIDSERAYLTERLSAMGGLTVYPSSANYLTARLAGGLPAAAELKETLLHKRLLIRDLSGFAGLGPRFFRVSVRTREENLLLAEAVACALSLPSRKAEPIAEARAALDTGAAG